MTDRDEILKQLEYWSDLRGRYTMVGDWCSAAMISKTIRALYRKLNPDYWRPDDYHTRRSADPGKVRRQ
jgi:hypothetical protein